MMEMSKGKDSNLRSPGQEARHVYEGYNWDVERVAEADETGGLDGRVDVQTA